MGQKLLSPYRQQQALQDNFQFASLLHSQPATPRKLNLTTVTTIPVSTSARPTLQRTKMEDGVEEEKGVEEESGVVNGLLATTRDGGRVKSMIDAIEQSRRTRSKTLPSLLSDSLSGACSDYHYQVRHSEGGFPDDPTLVLNGFNGHTQAEITPSAIVTTNGRDSPTPAGPNVGGDVSPTDHSSVAGKPFTRQPHARLTSAPNASSMEESASYVCVQPLPISDFGGKGERGRRGLAVSPSPAARLDDTTNSSESTPSKDMSHLTIQGSERVEDSRSLSSSPGVDDMSDELDRMSREAPLSDALPNPVHQADNSNNSAELDCQADNSPQLCYQADLGASSRKKKKKKWRLFKKRKSMDEQIDEKYGRSKSDALSEVENTGLRDSQRVRSRSHNMMMNMGVGEGRGGRSGGVDYYTMYMQDYSAKLEERKKHSPGRGGRDGPSTASQELGCDNIDRTSTDDDLDRGNVTPPAEMSPLAFRQSLYCKQLKFKLRSSLQKIHSSLSLSHTHFRLQDDRGVASSMRYQLILLIQHALQCSHWAHQDMETALLSEILRMVEPLPNEL